MTIVLGCIVLQGLMSPSRTAAANKSGDIARFIIGMPPWEGGWIWCIDSFASRVPRDLEKAYRKTAGCAPLSDGNNFRCNESDSMLACWNKETSLPSRFQAPLPWTKAPPHCKGKILLVGDSLMQGLGPSMQALFRKKGILVVSAAKPATGLTNRHFYPWEQQLPILVERHRPDVILFLLGANDIQGMRVGGRTVAFGTTPWKHEYLARIATLMEQAGDARVYWIGLPRMRNTSYDKHVKMLNVLFQDTVAHFEGIYIPMDEVFGPKDEPYSPYAYRGGRQVLVRAADGIHMTMKGYAIVTETVARRLLFQEIAK